MPEMRSIASIVKRLGLITLAVFTVDSTVAQPPPDVKGNIEVTPFTGTRGPGGVTRWKQSRTVTPQTLDAGSVTLKTITVKPGDTVTDLMARNGLRTDVHTLQTVLAVNPERASLDDVSAGDQITIPDVDRPEVTAFQLEFQPDLKLKTIASITRLNDKVEDLRNKPTFIKVKSDTRARIFAAATEANEIGRLDVPLLPQERDKLDAAIEDLEWTLTKLMERQGSLTPYHRPAVRRAAWTSLPNVTDLRTDVLDSQSRTIMTTAALMQLAQADWLDELLDWIAGNASKEVRTIAASRYEPTRVRFDIFVHTVAPNGAAANNLTVCRADAGVVREHAMSRYSAGSQAARITPACSSLGGLSTPVREQNVRLGLYFVWAVDSTGRVSCMTKMEVGSQTPATNERQQGGLTVWSGKTPQQLVELCDEPG